MMSSFNQTMIIDHLQVESNHSIEPYKSNISINSIETDIQHNTQHDNNSQMSPKHFKQVRQKCSFSENQNQKSTDFEQYSILDKKKGNQKKVKKSGVITSNLGWKEIVLNIPHCLDESQSRRIFLYGDFYFDLSKLGREEEECEFITSNKYKPQMSVQQNLKYDCVYLNIGTYQFNMNLPKYSEYLVSILNSQTVISHELVNLLKGYYMKVGEMENYIKTVHQQNNPLFKEREKLFEKYSEEFIENLEKENKIYLLVKKKLNLETGNLEYYQYILSKGLIFLLGMDVPSFIQMTMRSGRPNIFDSFSNIHFIEFQLQYLLNNKTNHMSKDIKIITLDGSLIPITMQFSIYNFNDRYPKSCQISGDHHNLLNMLGIIEIDVDPGILQQLIQRREQKKVVIDNNVEQLTSNNMYSNESYRFLLKYYLFNYSNQVTYKQFLKKRK